MIPLEYACSVLLLCCLQKCTLESMKELTHHSWVKSRGHMLRCSAMYALLLWATTLIGLSGVISGMWLGCLPCIVCCMLLLAYAYGVSSSVSVMTPPKYLHLSICFYFFSNVFAPKTPPPKARPRTSTYMEEIQIWKSKGPLHTVLVHILWVEVSPKAAILILST